MKKFDTGATLLAVLLVMVLTAVGCSTLSENSPTHPGETGTASTSTESYAEAYIRADYGGTLQLGDNRVIFPPGALSDDTMVSILREGSSTVFDLAPDGIQFRKPVTLTLEMAPVGGFGYYRHYAFPAIYYYNPQADVWENLGGVPDFANRVVTIQIEHFSRYGTKVPWIG